MPQVARRLPNASQAGMPPSYKIDDQFWNELEAVVGPIPSDARGEIVRAIEQYLWTVSAEHTAESLDDAPKRLREIQAQTAKTVKAVLRPSTCDADDFAFAVFGHNLHHRLIPTASTAKSKSKLLRACCKRLKLPAQRLSIRLRPASMMGDRSGDVGKA